MGTLFSSTDAYGEFFLLGHILTEKKMELHANRYGCNTLPFPYK